MLAKSLFASWRIRGGVGRIEERVLPACQFADYGSDPAKHTQQVIECETRIRLNLPR
jgi:hypothetical protein